MVMAILCINPALCHENAVVEKEQRMLGSRQMKYKFSSIMLNVK